MGTFWGDREELLVRAASEQSQVVGEGEIKRKVDELKNMYMGSKS